jgi:predicted nucleic acid-binding protein
VAWETRNGTRYYYRSVRDGKRVRKEYVGTGETAEALAHADEAIRLVRKLERDECQAEVEQMEELAAPMLEIAELAEVLARAHLAAGGYHKHKGEWRLRRGRHG